MLRRFFTLFASSVAAIAAAQNGAQTAGPQTYATRVQQIHAGVVILPTAKQNATDPPAGIAPHVWFNLDANRSVKPLGWNISNPHAPGLVTNEIASRWSNTILNPNAASDAPQVGDRIAKNQAAYWEVFLTQTSDSDLADYDVLLCAPKAYAQLNPLEREKLRKFVERGGVLWIDGSGLTSGTDPANGFPISFSPSTAGAGVQAADFAQPLLSQPNTLNARDMNFLNTGFNSAFNAYTIAPVTVGNSTVAPLFQTQVADSYRIQAVAGFFQGSSRYPTIGVAQLGDGYVVITTRGVASKLNRVPNPNVANPAPSYTENIGYAAFSPATLGPDGTAAAKLAVNIISLGADARHQASGAHRTSSTAVDIGAPLLARTNDPNVSIATSSVDDNVRRGGIFYKGLLIVSENDTLVAYDPNPGSDLDGDGNPDDGQFDQPGNGMDRVWQVQLAGPISAPVAVEVPDSQLKDGAGNALKDMVLVVDANGRLHSFNPLPRNANGSLSGGAQTELFTIDPPSTPSNTGIPLAPVAFEGMAYVADSYSDVQGDHGRVWAVNLAQGTAMKTTGQWFVGGGNTALSVPPFSAAPTVGYIPIQDNSGGLDRVMYIPFASTGSTSPAGFISLALGARGEKPTWEVVGNTLQVTTRASVSNGIPIYTSTGLSDPFGVRLTVIDTNTGNPLSASDMASIFSGPPTDMGGGILSFPLQGSFPSNYDVRIDYTIDWGGGNPGVLAGVERGRQFIPDVNPTGSGNGPRPIMGPIALTPRGSTFMTVGGSNVSALFGFREEGRGKFRCTTRYELYGSYSYTPQGGTPDIQAPIFDDQDAITSFAPAYLQQPMANFRISGPPAVLNDQVFVTANANKQGAIHVGATLVMAFKAEPDLPEFVVPDLPDGSQLVQADLSRSALSGSPMVADTTTVITPANFDYDSATRTLRLDSLSDTRNRGPAQPILSQSQRLYLRRPGYPDTALDPDLQGSTAHWSPLLWYSVMNGVVNRTGPIVTGDTLFVGGQSVVPNILSNGTLAVQGILGAMRSQISPTDPFLHPSSARSWVKQLYTLDVSSGVPKANPDMKWPQVAGAAGLNDYIVRLNQTVLPGSTDVSSIAAGAGVLAALGDRGLYTFDRADFLVADQGRVGIFDPSGNPIWTTNSYASTGLPGVGGGAKIHRFVRPTRAYRVDSNDLLVVDSGANRVVRMNQAGYEVRTISDLKLDKNHSPANYASGGPLSLSLPGDAVTFPSVELVSNQTNSVTLGDSEAANAYEYWVHTLVADTGNKRLIEVIDRYGYDPTTGQILDPITVGSDPQLGVLYWQSPPSVSGRGYAYSSISRIVVPTSPTTSKVVFVAGLGGAMPTREAAGVVTATPGAGTPTASAGGNGGVVIFDSASQTGPIVFNSLAVPAIGANAFYDETSGTFNSAAKGAQTLRMTNVSSVTTSADVDSSGHSLVRIMVTDATGIYEGFYDATNASSTPPTGTSLAVTWMLPNEAYRVMRRSGATISPANPKNLRATYARRLDAYNVIVVNGYLGTTRGGAPFAGEVLQIDGLVGSGHFDFNANNFGFGSGSIVFQLPPVQGTRELLLPAFADRR